MSLKVTAIEFDQDGTEVVLLGQAAEDWLLDSWKRVVEEFCDKRPEFDRFFRGDDDISEFLRGGL